MKAPSFVKKMWQRRKDIPKKYWIMGAVLAAILIYVLIFFIPKQVTFSYSGQTCVPQFVVAPDAQKQTGDGQFEATIGGGFSIGGARIVGTSICFAPKTVPKEGKVSTSLSLFGGVIGKKHFTVTVPTAPVVNFSALEGTSVSTVKPLSIALSEPDTIHAYTLWYGQESTLCTTSVSALECAVKDLALDHGHEYVLELRRALEGVKDASMVGAVSVKTVAAATLTGGSINEGKVIYDKPTALTLDFSTDITNASVTLVQEEGETKTPVEIDVSTEKNVATVDIEEQLERTSTFVLTVNDVEGTTGSSLADPVVIRFTTSGGPKVSSVSAAGSGIGQNEEIVLTFDQPIKSDADIAKLIKLSGAGGSVTKLNETQVSVKLKGAGLCAAISIVVGKDLPSGSNDEVAGEDWTFSSRVICGYSRVIGNSVKGRAITAYYFGSGSKVVLFTAGIHGSEPSSTSTMQAFVTWLQSNAYQIPGDKQVVVVPNVNPDGIAVGSRNNANNVNLGRNFPTANWSASIETASGVLPQGGGTSAGSEPEAAALITLTRQLRPRLEISYHAQGSLVGANKYGDSVAAGDIYASTVRYGTMYYNAEEVMGYAMTGEYEDWMGEEMGIPAILIELPRASGNYLDSQRPAIMKMLAL